MTQYDHHTPEAMARTASPLRYATGYPIPVHRESAVYWRGAFAPASRNIALSRD